MSEGSTAGVGSWILEMRQRLVDPPPKQMVVGDRRAASVLVPLYVNSGQLWVLLTKRSDALPQHSGQVAFPGGGCEVGENAWEAALRETREEIGLEEKVLPD